MEQTNSIKNDFRPILIDGKPSELQAAKEYSYLFWHVLKGYGLPFQLIKFIYKIYELTKPGNIFHLNDFMIADALGITSESGRSYVCRLRKKLKEWQSDSTDTGIRHFCFVSITENNFNRKTKKQTPTGYETSQDLENLLIFLLKRVRENPKYRENWTVAIKQTCGEFERQRLIDFGGYFNPRRQKRERDADSILGTMLLNWKRTAAKMLEFSRLQGFGAQNTKEVLSKLLPQFLEQAFAELILKESQNKWNIKPSEQDAEMFFGAAVAYVNQREKKPETVFPKNYHSEKKDDVCSITRQSIASEKSDDQNAISDVSEILESRKTLGIDGSLPIETDLDFEQLRFLKKHKKRE